MGEFGDDHRLRRRGTELLSDVLLPTGVVVPSWVRLPHVDREDLEQLTLRVVKRDVLEYRCPICGNRERSDIAGLEPCCTGPGYTDEHPMEVMVLVDKDRMNGVIPF